MFRLARMWRLKIVQHGSLYRTSRQLQCGVNSEIIDYALRATKEVLLRDKPAQVAGFNRVKLRPSSPLIDEIPLSQIVMHVDLADETPLLLRDLSPTLLKCVETVLEGGGLEAKGALSAAVANLKSGLNRLLNPEGQFGLSDYTLKALGSASKMLETDANVKIVAEILLPLMKGYCVFNMHHRKALEAHTIKNRMFLPPSLHWNGLAIGNSKLWFGELDMLLCPHIGILQEPGHFPIAVVQKSDGDFVPELSIAVEGKRIMKEEWSLLGGRTHFAQAYATAIVFSFLCHYKFNMKRSFIPSLFISPQAFAVFFYDCREDIMISKACLWSEYTLVFLWSVLHYPIFYPSSWLDLGIESLPFGYLNNVRTDFKFIDEKEFHFGESLKSPAFRQTNPFLGRPICDLRDKPDKGVVFDFEPENNQDDEEDR